MHVLVTGGAGYIGSHTAKALKKKGYTPVVYDDLSSGHKDFVQFGPFVQGKLSDEKKVEETFRKYPIQAVMHFAASSQVIESMNNPLRYYENNLVESIALFRVMERHQVRKIVFSSSCATYGTPKTETISEETPQNPINPYGRSKKMIEEMLNDFSLIYDWKCAYLRYFNAAGADSDCQIGEKHDPETHLIPLVLLSALGKIKPFTVFGNTFDTPDGSAIRDYIHVDDLADAHILSLEHLLQNKPTFAVNLGREKGISVLEIIRTSETILKRAVPHTIAAARPGEPARLVAKGSRAKEILGWSPKRDLETILASALAWHERTC